MHLLLLHVTCRMGAVNLVSSASAWGSSSCSTLTTCTCCFSQILIVESLRTIVTHNKAEETNKLNYPSLIAVGVAFGQSDYRLSRPTWSCG